MTAADRLALRRSRVLSATRWRDNAEMIAAAFAMHVTPRHRSSVPTVLDPTYGKGGWWNARYWPAGLPTVVAHDKDLDGTDFRKLDHPDASFAAIAYDPPYVCVGGRTTTTLPEFQDAYGMDDAPTTPNALQDLIDDGLTEMWRLACPGATVLVKCQDYVSSGRLWLGEDRTTAHALGLGFRVADKWRYISGGGRPQPSSRTRRRRPSDGPDAPERVPTVQQHAHRNESLLLVLRKPGALPRAMR